MGVKFDYILGRLRLSDSSKDGNSNLLHLGTFTNYTDLVTQFPTADEIGTLAYVAESQGTEWLPGSWGGDFYSKGTYYWTGSVWDSNVDDIANALNDIYQKLLPTIKYISFVDSPYTANWFEDINCDCTLGEVIVNLPDAASKEGYGLSVTKTDNSINKIVVQAFAGESILTNNDKDIRYQYTSIPFLSDGINMGVR